MVGESLEPVFGEDGRQFDTERVKAFLTRDRPLLQRMFRNPLIEAPTRTAWSRVRSAREVVVSRYREDIGWLQKLPSNFHVVVYDKGCGARPSWFPPTWEFNTLANTRREAGTMLVHLIRNYHNLADLTYFLPGDARKHSPDLFMLLEHEFTDTHSLSLQYTEDHPAPEYKAGDMVVPVGHTVVRYGDATLFHGPTPDDRPFFDHSAWDYVFATPRPSPHWFAYAAMLVVPRFRVLERPLDFYRHLLLACDDGFSLSRFTDPPVNPWSLEAMWYAIFSGAGKFQHRELWREKPLPPRPEFVEVPPQEVARLRAEVETMIRGQEPGLAVS